MVDDSSSQSDTLGSALTDAIAVSGLHRQTSRLLGLQLIAPRPNHGHTSPLHSVGVAGQGLDCQRLTEILDSCSPERCQYVAADRVSLPMLFGNADDSENDDGYLLDPAVETTVVELTAETDATILRALAQVMRSDTYFEYKLPNIDTHAVESRLVCIYRAQSGNPSIPTLLSETLYPFVGAADLWCSFATQSEPSPSSTAASALLTERKQNVESGFSDIDIASRIAAHRAQRLGFSDEAKQQLCQYWTTIARPQTEPAVTFGKGIEFQSEVELIEESLRDSLRSLSTASAKAAGNDKVQKEDIYNAIGIINDCRSFCEILVNEVAFWVQHTDQAANQGVKPNQSISCMLREASPEPVSLEKLHQQCLDAGYEQQAFEKALDQLRQQGEIRKTADDNYLNIT